MSTRYLQKRNRHNNRKLRGDRDKRATREMAIPALAKVQPVAKTRLIPGAVVWASVPFVDGTGDKTRPAVVERREGRSVVVRPVTTSERRHSLSYHEVIDLAAAGLARASGIASQVVEIDVRDVIQVVGHLGPDDEVRLLGGPALVGESA